MAVDPAVSADEYETQFATNHVGHALLVKLLLSIMESTARRSGDVRIINLTSIAYEQAPKMGIDFATLRSSQEKLGGMIPGGKSSRYGQSKLAQMLYTQEVAKHHPEVTSVSVHPRFIMTGLLGNVDLMTKLPVLLISIGKRTPVKQGHFNQCWAATCKKSDLRSGEYYEPLGVIGERRTKQAKDQKLAEEL
ncbi:hypothetical protein B0A55_13163 [Friedmanniomyces simplex]|uniref:Oxidoreductase n=1 Tax=Friedmanniomyces simplex TaxID=329884 RepID=A0A4U0WVC0_9PEZI|nr:hypothetical protein B0A55_13163 [Friedmanniomyces simplex]